MKRLHARIFVVATLFFFPALAGKTTSISAQETAHCQADFFFSFLDSTTVHLYNNSTGYDSVAWQFSEGTVRSRTDRTITLSVPNGYTYVCLSVTGSSGCTDQYCLDVFPGAPGEVCSVTDCVWPGDANGDRRANNYDVLYIGLGYGTQGPARTYTPIPDDPLAWTPSHAENWSNWLGIVNYKHLDCDGNGIVDYRDLLAIHKNYQPDLQYDPEPHPEAPPLELKLDKTVFFVPRNSAPDSITVTGTLYAGSIHKPVENLYGLAFSVRYHADLARAGSAQFHALPNSFLAEGDSLIDLNIHLNPPNHSERTDYAITKTNGRPVDGAGPIAAFSLIIEADIIGGREIIDIDMELDKIKAVDSLGNDIPLHLTNQQITISVVADDLTSANDLPAAPGRFSLAPNPAGNRLWFQSNDSSCSFIEILDLTGRSLLRKAVQEPNQQINLQGLPAGPLILRAWYTDGTSTGRLFVKTPTP